MKKYLPDLPFKATFSILVTTLFVIQLHAQERTLSLTGYTEDVIADAVLNTLPPSVTTGSLDLSGSVFFAQGYSNNSTAYTNGLPINGQFTSSAGHNFQLAPYNENNDLRLVSLQSGTLAFAVADQIEYNTLYILATAGSGGSSVGFTINFTDATTATGTLNIDDWFCNGCTTYAIKDLSRVDPDGDVNGPNLFALREYAITLSASDQAKQISSIDFSVPPGQPGVVNIMGITAIPTSTVPVTLEYFTARAENGKALLQWKASQEINNKKYIIERSTKAEPSNFVVVGEVQAVSSGNSSIYNFVNIPGASGLYFYRLTQEDVDGHKKIMGTKTININNGIKWVIQDLGIQWRLICEQPFIYHLLDIHGRIVQYGTASGSMIISKPSSRGIYQLVVESGGKISSQKLLK
jgi:hypothetical protein